MNIKLIIIFLLIGFASIHCTSIKQALLQNCKPDLLITGVVHKMDYEREYIAAVFAVTIKNIGTAALTDAFYLSYTGLKNDILVGHYSASHRVTSDKIPIPIGDSIIVNVSVMAVFDMLEAGSTVKFFIDTDGKPHTREANPRIEELNYDNNTYEYIMPTVTK